MAWGVLMSERWALTWRPKKFSEVLGQKHVIAFFKIILDSYYKGGKRLPVGVLFSGYSGVGKTTLARIIAASLNCDKREGVEPCGVCDVCKQIIDGKGGILEIDASYFGLVENVRALRSRLHLYSLNKYQVVILDECHMMSKEAFNVLLKLLEEPPKSVLFILVTTEAEKVLDTVKSRLLEFSFRHIPWAEIDTFLEKLLKAEDAVCKLELCRQVYYLSNYNLRDVIVTLEQLSILGKGTITAELVAEVCGDLSLFATLTNAVLEGDYSKAVGCYETFIISQPDLRVFLDGFTEHLSSSLLRALRTSHPNANKYGGLLHKLYSFRSTLVALKSLSSVKLLLFEMCAAISGEVYRSSESRTLSPEEIIKALTKE